jgi:hypothetical protein
MKYAIALPMPVERPASIVKKKAIPIVPRSSIE